MGEQVLYIRTYDGHDEGMRPRFTGLKQVMAQILDCIFPWLLHNVIWWTVGLSAVLVHKAVVTKQYVTDWKRKGVRVMAWTVNSPLEKAAMRHIVGIQVLSDSLERYVLVCSRLAIHPCWRLWGLLFSLSLLVLYI